MAQATDMPAWAAVAGEENEGKGRELGGRLVLPLVPLLLARCWPRLSWLAVRCLLFALFGVSFEDSHWVNPTTFTVGGCSGKGWSFPRTRVSSGERLGHRPSGFATFWGR